MSRVLWKVEILVMKLGYVAEQVFKPSVEDMGQLLLKSYGKNARRKNDLKMELLIKL